MRNPLVAAPAAAPAIPTSSVLPLASLKAEMWAAGPSCRLYREWKPRVLPFDHLHNHERRHGHDGRRRDSGCGRSQAYAPVNGARAAGPSEARRQASIAAAVALEAPAKGHVPGGSE